MSGSHEKQPRGWGSRRPKDAGQHGDEKTRFSTTSDGLAIETQPCELVSTDQTTLLLGQHHASTIGHRIAQGFHETDPTQPDDSLQ